MYKIVKNVIAKGTYDLRDILKKIDTVWVNGNLTEEQRAELISLAQGKAQTSNSVDILAKLEELDKRVKALEASAPTTEEEEPEDTTETVTYPEYEAGKWYYKDNVVMFEGTAYICIAPENVVCVWSPSEYPTYWQVYEPVEETTE